MHSYLVKIADSFNLSQFCNKILLSLCYRLQKRNSLAQRGSLSSVFPYPESREASILLANVFINNSSSSTILKPPLMLSSIRSGRTSYAGRLNSSCYGLSPGDSWSTFFSQIGRIGLESYLSRLNRQRERQHPAGQHQERFRPRLPCWNAAQVGHGQQQGEQQKKYQRQQQRPC